MSLIAGFSNQQKRIAVCGEYGTEIRIARLLDTVAFISVEIIQFFFKLESMLSFHFSLSIYAKFIQKFGCRHYELSDLVHSTAESRKAFFIQVFRVIKTPRLVGQKIKNYWVKQKRIYHHA